MLNTLLAIPTKTKLLILALIGIIILTTVIIALQAPQEKAVPPKQIQTPSGQETIVGKKITPDIEERLDIINKEASSDGTLIYSLNSQNAVRNDQIITQNQQIIFQRYYVPENPNDPNHLLISNLLEKYGQPERIIEGSKLWGRFMKTYIYGSKGIAFIGNPNTNEVYELQNFTPLSLEEYIQKYGDDIDQIPPGPES